MTRRACFKAYSIKSKVVAAVTGIMGLIAAQFVCYPSAAQLKPWGHSNDVLVDMSIVGNHGTGFHIETGSRLSISILGAQLLEPPRRMPVSRLLSPGTPMKRARLESEASTIKLVPPSKLRKRSAVAKRKTTIKAPRKAARKLRRNLKPSTRAPKNMAKNATAPVPPAKPKPKVITGNLPLMKSSQPPPAPSLAKAAPPKRLAPNSGKVTGTVKRATMPNPVQQASKPPETPETQTAFVPFAAGASALTPTAQKNLATIVARMKSNAAMRLQLMAYAGEAKLSPSKARRLSLARALAVRSFLIKQGIRSTRIDVRALGNKVPPGGPSRVDLRVFEN